MKIGICGNIALESFAISLDALVQNSEVIVGQTELYESELSKPFGLFAQLDICIIILDWRPFATSLYNFAIGDDIDLVLNECNNALTKISELIIDYRKFNNAQFLIFSPISDWYSPAGFIDRLQISSIGNLFAQFQNRFNEMCRLLPDVYPIDMEELSNRCGKDSSFDNLENYLKNSPFSLTLINSAAQRASDILIQFSKPPIKCLILDCDNTLWGDILGECGFENILLGDTGKGKAFKDFQSEILRLYRQGIMLAICSKNTTCEVMEVMERHEHMLIRPSMIANFRINWDDKPKNVIEIAKELNIGLNSIMFIDDMPFEREGIAATLPDVEIFPLPEDPCLYAQTFRKHSRLWPIQITDTDSGKAVFNQQQALRKQQAEIIHNSELYLESLNIKVQIMEADKNTLPRAVQLFNKTNQFNLTSKRYTQTQLDFITQNKENRLWVMSMKDRFGDFGIIASALTIGNNINAFVLSCRSFGRQIENALLIHILHEAAISGFSSVTASFLPSLKNNMTKSFYLNMGFIETGRELNNIFWEFNLENKISDIPRWITISS